MKDVGGRAVIGPALSGASRSGPYYEEEEHHHYGFVVVAVIVSLIAHYVMMERARDMRFDVTASIDRSFRPAPTPPSRVDSIHEDPLRPVENPFAGDPAALPALGISGDVSLLASAPDAALSAPRVSDEALAAAKDVPVALPTPSPPTEGWMPRQQIMAVADKLVRDDIAPLPRIEIPAIERIAAAPDYIPPVDLLKDIRAKAPEAPRSSPLPTDTPAAAAPEEIVPTETPTPEAQTPEATISRFGDKPSDISSFKPVDSRLMARAFTFRPEGDTGRCYFRLQVAARDPSVLPVVPKDIVFVQDASRSLAEERLHFCRDALEAAVRSLPPGDRFNVALFRDDVEFCFPSWASPNAETIEQAAGFIRSMRAKGDTDVFRSLQTLLALPRDSARPLIVILVTDGKATVGLTESSRIIGEFSKLNDNVSVFVVGTHGRANNYLLDMLAFCNRGSAQVVTSGRWDIPKAIASIIDGSARPVLGRVGVTTALASHADLYPLPSANLYADRTLEYYGSCPADVTNLVFQVRGEGGGSKCDIVFQMDLGAAAPGGADIRDAWVARRMYTLVGDYARSPSPAILDAMRRLSLETGMPIPYMDQVIQRPR